MISIDQEVGTTSNVTFNEITGTLKTVSQTNITGVGTITTGTWNASAITDSYIASASTWNGKQDALTFNPPSDNNSNPSTSAQIKSALDLKANSANPSFTGTISIGSTSLGLEHLSNIDYINNEIILGINTTTAIIPSLNNSIDLGSSGKKFDVLYASKLNNGVSFTLPTSDGSSGQFLKTDGNGTLSWGTASGGGGASALNDLSDVSTSGAQTNYALVYNGSSWAPAGTIRKWRK